MNPASLSRASLALLLVAVLAGGVAIGSVVTAFADGGAGQTPAPTPSPSPLATDRAAQLPDADVDGEDLERLPRYPGSVRTEYEVSRDDRYRLTAVEYVADATVEEVRAFYQQVMDDHGWDRADVNYAAGEWTYVLVDGRTEALVEIEEWNALIEIDLQVSQPVRTPEPEPQPTPTRKPEPTRPPAPAQPAPPPPDDGGDDDDDDDGDDDDTDDGDGSDG